MRPVATPSVVTSVFTSLGSRGIGPARLRVWAAALACALALHGLALRDTAAEAPALRQRTLAPLPLPVMVVQPTAAARPLPSGGQALIELAAVPAPVKPPPAYSASPQKPAEAGRIGLADPAPRVSQAAVGATAPQPAESAETRAEVLDEHSDEARGSGAPAPEAAALLSLPLYATQLPGSFAVPLQARRLNAAAASGAERGSQPREPASGAGELRFERDEQGQYQLALSLQSGARPWMDLRSKGRVGAAGLEPERFTDRRRGRSASAANFDPVTRQARFSGRAAEVDLAQAAQDRVSWMLQLPAVIRADPSLQRPGAVVWLQVVGARGGSQVWRFESMGPQTVELPDGQVVRDAWRWLRRAEQAYDLQVEAWLLGSDMPLPVLARLTPMPGGAALEMAPAGPTFGRP